jgi:4,5-dihydroxyphthalate decarboxylase
MSATPGITIHGGDYEHTQKIGGETEGACLRYATARRVQDIFIGMLESRRFEVCEFSLANYITLHAAGERWLTAIPVFPSRVFRHGFAVTRRDSKITRLNELAGKRIGVPDYSMTAAVWFRGLIEEEYGVDLSSIEWVTRAKQRFAFPPQAKVQTTEADLEELLVSGEIDVLLNMHLADSARPPAERRLRSVLHDVQAEEEAYYRKTGIYPIMHCVVIREDVLKKYPDMPSLVFRAYENAKQRAYERQLGSTLVPWGKQYWARMFDLFGGDPLPYGLTPVNRMVVERLATYLKRQGFIDEIPTIDALFAGLSSRAP